MSIEITPDGNAISRSFPADPMTEHDPLIEELDLAVMPPQSRALTNAQVLDIVRRARIAGAKAERESVVEWLRTNPDAAYKPSSVIERGEHIPAAIAGAGEG